MVVVHPAFDVSLSGDTGRNLCVRLVVVGEEERKKVGCNQHDED